MYRKITQRITDSLIKGEIIESDNCDVYEYGMEIVISDLVYFTLAVLTAIGTKTLFETFLFYIGFFSIRKYAGGFHANSYWMCHLLFLANQIGMIILQAILPVTSLLYLTVGITFISVCCIFLFAPVANENRSYTECEQKKFAISSRIISVLTALGVGILIVSNVQTKYIFVYTFGVFSVAASLVAEKIKIKMREEGLK